jgi:hypothetical protein
MFVSVSLLEWSDSSGLDDTTSEVAAQEVF